VYDFKLLAYLNLEKQCWKHGTPIARIKKNAIYRNSTIIGTSFKQGLEQ
jgi:hypothetical protein